MKQTSCKVWVSQLVSHRNYLEVVHEVEYLLEEGCKLVGQTLEMIKSFMLTINLQLCNMYDQLNNI